jgi:small subunit ribosomal protein S19
MRSNWKIPFVSHMLLNREALSYLKTTKRNSTVIPQQIGQVFAIHNGKEYVEHTIHDRHVGKKLGEFKVTKKKARFKLKYGSKK